MAQQILSNKVYESLHEPTNISRKTTGKVIYANRFSGVSEVSMPDDLKSLIDGDFGLMGKNILVQLEQKMRGYANGPWYVDSRDGVIYIHNRKFNEAPVYQYNYQQENGEVLKISFSTQIVTKNTKVVLTAGVDPENKDLIVGTTGIDEAPQKEDPYMAKVDNLMVSGYGSNNIEDFRNSPTTNIQAEFRANSTDYWPGVEKYFNYKKQLSEYDASDPKASKKAAEQKKLDNMSTVEIRDAINLAISTLPDDKKRSLEMTVGSTAIGKDLEANLYKIMKDEMYLFEKDQGIDYVAEEEVDPRDYDPQQKGFDGATAWGIKEASSVDRGMEALRKDPYIEVISEAKILYKNSIVKSHGVYGVKVKIRHLKRDTMKVPLYKLYHNLMGRFGGADKYAWAMNANANGGLKTKERRLVCQMQVIGRPSLQSSDIIIINNVGNKWSGPWYIKSCTHQMDNGQGYITNMDLVKNRYQLGQESASTKVSTQYIVASDAKDQAKTKFGKDKEALSKERKVTWNPTYNEKIWYKEAYLNPDGTLNDIKGATQFQREAMYYNEVNANDPLALAEGIVPSSGNTITSSGKLIPGKLTKKDIKVPEDYDIKFNYKDIAKKVYQDRLKAKGVNINKGRHNEF